jgi:hypothetical protein
MTRLMLQQRPATVQKRIATGVLEHGVATGKSISEHIVRFSSKRVEARLSSRTPRITFSLDETKIAQVVGIFVSRCGGLFDYYLAMKAIYHLDREAILRWGQPVVGGEYKMLPYGPVNQSAMDATKPGRQSFFSECVERIGNEIHLKKDPGTDELSMAEMRLTVRVCDEWKNLSFSKAHEKANSFPECKGLEGVDSIPVEHILSSEGRTAKEIAALAVEIEGMRRVGVSHGC